jgi:hypothetical protein
MGCWENWRLGVLIHFNIFRKCLSVNCKSATRHGTRDTGVSEIYGSGVSVVVCDSILFTYDLYNKEM